MLSLIFLLACSAGTSSFGLDDAPTLLISSVKIFDTQSGALSPPQDVLIEEGKISAILAAQTASVSGVDEIDGRGRTLLPGLVDSHTHLGGSVAMPNELTLPNPRKNLEAWLRSGVTTIFDLGGLVAKNKKLAAQSEEGRIASPRIYTAPPPITQTDGHPIPIGKELLPRIMEGALERLVIQVDDPQDVAAAIDQALREGPDYIKIILDELPLGTPKLNEAVVVALVAEAHSRNKKVVVHIGSEEEALMAVRAGADILAHSPHRGRISDEGIDQLAASGVPVVATLNAFQAAQKILNRSWEPSTLDRELWPDISAALKEADANILHEQHLLRAFTETISLDMSENVRRMHDAGVLILPGSDAPVPGSFPGSGLHAELHALHEAGIPSAELLRAATSGPRDILAAGAEWGEVKLGAPAEFLLVEGDPVADLRVLSQIVCVFRNGKKLKREK